MLGGAENIHEIFKPTQRKKKSNSNSSNSNSNSRRFSDEQIKSLESLFKMENKLEPRKKLELARELGLHPRQVAIWFQNRRARWKSKQVEQDYTALKADYHNLSDRFESLKKEKHALLQQLRNLCSQLKEPCEFEESKDLDSGSENGGNSLEQDMAIYSDEEKQSREEEVNLGDENFEMLDSLLDESCGSGSNWWDLWSSN